MKALATFIIVFMAGGLCSREQPSRYQAEQTARAVASKEGLTSEQAISIARHTLAQTLGSDAAERFAPYEAELKGDRWVVTGDPHLRPNEFGGGPMIEVSRLSGEVVSKGWGA